MTRSIDINKITKRIGFEYLSIYSDLSPKTYNNHRGSLSAIWALLAIYDVENIWKDIPARTSRFRKAVYIHLHKDVIDVLNKASENNLSDYFYPEAVEQYGSGSFGVQFKKILKKANVTDNKHGKASFHSLRSTFITNCEEAGISRTVIQGIVGHGSPHMTERYSEDKKSGSILKDMPSIK